MNGDILIVDDQPANLSVLETLLEAEGYKVRATTSGSLALRAVAARAPELILLDVIMPDMDGYEVCRRLKQNPATAAIPVLFLSAHAETAEKLRAFEAGGQDYITKPFAVLEVLVRVQTQLARGRMEAQLKQTNQELEAFTYSVSHDLRAPLRRIMGYLQAFQEDYGAQLEAPGLLALEHIATISQHMQALIDDLLQLSQVSRAELQRQRVDLSALARAIVTEFQAAEPARQVELAIAPGLLAPADPGLIRAALTNLLSNAWKFTSQHESARIEFGALAEMPVTYFVRDNGVGFDMAQADRLFDVFQRLHSVAEFPGTGVGLAIVRRIIQRHGGRIWAESLPGQGAVFYFTLDATPTV